MIAVCINEDRWRRLDKIRCSSCLRYPWAKCTVWLTFLWLLIITKDVLVTQLNWASQMGCLLFSTTTQLSNITDFLSSVHQPDKSPDFLGFSGPVSAAQNPCCFDENWGVLCCALFLCARPGPELLVSFTQTSWINKQQQQQQQLCVKTVKTHIIRKVISMKTKDVLVGGHSQEMIAS